MSEKTVKDAVVGPFRLPADKKNDFTKTCSEVGTTQADAFDQMFEVWKRELGKKTLLNRRAEIEIFEKLCKDILSKYTYSLEVYEKTESRIEEQFANSLYRKDRMIEELQNECIKLRESKEEEDKKAKGLIKTCADAVKRANEAKKLSDIAESLCAEKDRTIASLNEKLEKANGLLDQATKEAETLRSDMQRKDDDFTSRLDDAKTTADTALKMCEEKNSEIGNLRKELTEAVEAAKRVDELKSQIEIDKDRIRGLTKQIEDARHKAEVYEKEVALKISNEVHEKELKLTAEMMEKTHAADKEIANLQAQIRLLQMTSSKDVE